MKWKNVNFDLKFYQNVYFIIIDDNSLKKSVIIIQIFHKLKCNCSLHKIVIITVMILLVVK